MAVNLVVHEKNFTMNIDFAIEVGKYTGKPPITFISKNIRSLALAAHPELARRPKPNL